ncbi:MAG: T9SS type A sorting domain-containing protein [Candidatus Delongbacteria bacterium]|nr:T9SS type A sorting domain-containing protein [Candidatus Delongbacteria bacterium]
MKTTTFLLTLLLLAVVPTGPTFAVDSLNVNLVGRLNLCWDNTGDLALQDGLVYMSAGNSGVRILDVTQPEQPLEIGWCDTWSSATSVAVADNYAYVATYFGGFFTFDVSDPLHPIQTNWQELEYMLSEVIVQDGYLWLAGRWYGLYIFALDDPAAPELIGTCETAGSETFDLAVSDTLAFLIDGHQGLHVVNVADPTQPVEIGSCMVPSTSWGVAAGSEWVYVASNQLHVVDITPPQSPWVHSSWSPDCYATGVEIHNEHIWVTSNSGLFIASIANPAYPAAVGSLEDSYANGIAFDGDLACLSAGNASGLRTLNIADPAAVVELGSLARPLKADRLVVDGDLAVIVLDGYLQPYTDGLMLVDISNPSLPLISGTLELETNLAGIAMQDDYAFAAASGEGLKVIDISNPEQPFLAAVYDTTTPYSDIALREGYAFVAVPQEGLRALDISSPLNPSTIGILGIADGTFRLALAGDLACVLGQGFNVVDVSDPWVMEMRGSTNDFPGMPCYVAASGSVACVVWQEDGNGGVAMVDISDPDNPQTRGWITTPGGDCASGVVIRDHYACVADQYGDVQIVDFSDLDNPVVTGYYPMPDRTCDVAWHEDGTIYAVDGNDLEALDFTLLEAVSQSPTAPDQFALLQAWPNPFNDQITLEVSLTEPGRVSLEVYDLLGRQVDRLQPGALPAGSSHLTWSGAGSSGIYFVQLLVNSEPHDLLKVTQVK